jgi:hypothetical protein
MAEIICSLKKRGSSGGTDELVMCALTGVYEKRAGCFTDNNIIKMNQMINSSTAYTISGTDFSATVGTGNATLTVKKSGTYLIRDANGSESEQQITANATVTVPAFGNPSSSKTWSIRKIK